MVVGFLGVDGSGKSTVLAALSQGAKIGSCSVRIIERRTHAGRTRGAIDHHALPPRSFFVSTLKVLFRWFEHWIHFLTVEIPPRLKGQLLLVDSPYFADIQVDPLKYRYGGSTVLLRMLHALLPRPHLYIVLDLPELQAYARKQEMAFESVVRLREVYLQFARQHKNWHVINAGLPVDDVVQQARHIIVEHLARR